MELRSDVINTTNAATVAGGSSTVSKGSSSSDVKNSNASTDAFSTFLKANMPVDGSGQVNEEDLFSAIVAQRIQALKGDDGLKKFQTRLADAKNDYRSVESATKWALMQMQQANEISYEDGNKLHAQAFDAAQLDDNKDVLFDGVGSKTDPTKAVATLETALLSARTKIEAFDDGTKTPLERPVSVINTGTGELKAPSSSTTAGGVTVSASSATPTGGTVTAQGLKMDGAGGFLFKPVADNDGRLAVLSPDGVGPLVQSVRLLDSKGNSIEEGRFTSFGDDGNNRAKYSFKKPGGSYEKNISVEIKYIDGTVQNYQIPDPSKRYD